MKRTHIFSIIILFGFGCTKDDLVWDLPKDNPLDGSIAIATTGQINPQGAPVVNTGSASNVLFTSANVSGNITDLGDDMVTQHGHCWSTSTNPTVNNSKTTLGTASTTGNYSSSLTGLSSGTTYYVRAYATNSTGTAYGNEVSFTTTGGGLAIGDSYQGGIIFYLDGNGGGLIAATSNSNISVWGCNGTVITGADGTAVGTGNQNTIDIEAGCATVGTAADICANLTLNSYSDWFLPSKDELNLMYQNIGQGNALGLGNVGGFASVIYWSSAEFDNGTAWFQSFSSGYQGNGSKASNIYVRSVRAF